MPVRTIPDTDVSYALICFDADGVERAESDGTMLSETVRTRLSDPTEAITDVFFCSHGWQGDVPAAISQYDRWVTAMVSSPDLARASQMRPGFKSIVIGVHWPSLPFGDESMPASVGVLSADDGTDIEALIDQFGASISNTKPARDAIRLILAASEHDDGEREQLPDNVRNAYETLAREARMPLGGSNPGGAPGEEQGEWSADEVYAQARASAVAESDDATSAGTAGVLGGGFFGKLQGLWQAPLQQMSFWKMKDRARAIGEGGVHALLTSLQQAAPAAHFHLMGHSFGCIVMSATVAGAPGGPPLARPVETLFLAQGALSLWSYASDLPVAPGKVGYFNRILTDGLVRGPIVTTQSTFDTAVGKLYPIAVKVSQQFVLGDEYPKFGSVGTFGIQGVGDAGVNGKLGPEGHTYGFDAKHVYNLESSDVIKNGSGASGAHSDIAHPEVVHAFWEAVLHV